MARFNFFPLSIDTTYQTTSIKIVNFSLYIIKFQRKSYQIYHSYKEQHNRMKKIYHQKLRLECNFVDRHHVRRSLDPIFKWDKYLINDTYFSIEFRQGY